jgi:hypothetical protein
MATESTAQYGPMLGHLINAATNAPAKIINTISAP